MGQDPGSTDRKVGLREEGLFVALKGEDVGDITGVPPLHW